MSLKRKVYDHCVVLLQQKIDAVNGSLEALRASLANETKSTAGDKYETARAMLHLEQEQFSTQLAVLKSQKATLDKIDGNSVHDRVSSGSLVETDAGIFFIAIALGKIDVEGDQVYVLSADAPLAKSFLSRSVGDIIALNERKFLLRNIS